MKKRTFLNILIAVLCMAALMLSLCACGEEAETPTTQPTELSAAEPQSSETPTEAAYPGETCTYINERIDIAASFVLPELDGGWRFVDNSSVVNCFTGISYYPIAGDTDPTKAWSVQLSLNLISAENKEWNENRDLYEDESIVETANGLKWLCTADKNGTDVRYTAYLGEYLDGFRRFTLKLYPYGSLEEGQSPDLELRDSITESIINTLSYTNEFEGKRDISDGIYSGNLQVKWPAEIPFEDGVIHAVRTVDSSDSVSILFSYEDPVRVGMIYTIVVKDVNHYSMPSSNETNLQYKYFGADPVFKEHEYDEGVIAGYPAAISREFGNSKIGTEHSVIVDFFTEGCETYHYIDFRSAFSLDKSKAEAAKDAGNGDFSWLTEDYDAFADAYAQAKVDEVLAAIVAAAQFVQ